MPNSFNQLADVNVLAQTTVIGILGLTADPQAPYKVRLDWPTSGAPDWANTEDIVFLRCLLDSDEWYNRCRDRFYQQNDGVTMFEDTDYTRVWNLFFTLYGPASFDHARMIRSAMFQQATHDIFANSNMYCKPDIPDPVRAPEEFGMQWWERVDLRVPFYEAVREEEVINAVGSVEVEIFSDLANVSKPDADFTVLESGLGE